MPCISRPNPLANQRHVRYLTGPSMRRPILIARVVAWKMHPQGGRSMQEREGVRQLPKMENHLCFGCGPANEHGLNMQFYGNGASIMSWVTVPGHLCGWNNLVHGGIISTLLDEIMSSSVVYVLQAMGMTRSMSLDFIQPVYAGREIKVQSRILEVKNGREATVEGILSNENGEICAKSTGTYVLFSPEKIRKMGIITDDVVGWFEHFIQGREVSGQGAA